MDIGAPRMAELVRRDYRCRACGRKLCRAHVSEDTWLQIRCPRCGQMFEVNGRKPNPLDNNPKAAILENDRTQE